MDMTAGPIAVMTALTFVGSYVVASLLLFKYPNLIHRKKTPKFRCTHISHRGGAGENLENTMAAFDHAVAVGTDMLEIDLQLTKDGVVVVSHDSNLKRVAGINVEISETNYDDLPPLRQCIPIDFDPGRTCTGGPDRNIPRLADVFRKYPRLPINVDVKSENCLLIQKVSELVKEYDREKYTVWGNFSHIAVKKCYEQNPHIATFFSSRAVWKLLLLTYTGLLPFVPLQESFLEIFLPSIFLRREFPVENKRPMFHVVIWMAEKFLIRRAIFQHLNKRGIQTYLWVLNTNEEYERAFRVGATGVMTDYPTRLRDFLDRNPQYRSALVEK